MSAWKRQRISQGDAGCRARYGFSGSPNQHRGATKLVAEYSSGFVYLVSRTGITGEQQSISDSALPLIERVRAHTRLPVAIGFGISTPAQVAALAPHADAVVIGSAIVRQIHSEAAQLEPFMRKLTEPLYTGRQRAAIS